MRHAPPTRARAPGHARLFMALLALSVLVGCTDKEAKNSTGDAGSQSAVTDPVKKEESTPTNPPVGTGSPPANTNTGRPTSAPVNPPPAVPVSNEPGVVIGRVDGLNGPIHGLHIQLQGDKLIQGKTDEAGEFIISDVPPGEYVINVVDMSSVTKGIMRTKTRGTIVPPGGIAEENFEMGFGFNVFGQITGVTGDPNTYLVSILRDGAPDLTGSPIGDMTLQYELAKHLEGSSFVSPEHTYDIIDIPTGTYELRVQKLPSSGSSPSAPWSSPALRMTIEVGDKELEQNLVLTP